MKGGYLPITSFFVLSGFLITALLLLERNRTGRIDCRAFWMRRARRLVPGALAGIGLAGLYVAVAAGSQLPELRGDTYSSLLWFTNWRFILSNQSYADLFRALAVAALLVAGVRGSSSTWCSRWWPRAARRTCRRAPLVFPTSSGPWRWRGHRRPGCTTRATCPCGVLRHRRRAVSCSSACCGLRHDRAVGPAPVHGRPDVVDGAGLVALVVTLAMWVTGGGYADGCSRAAWCWSRCCRRHRAGRLSTETSVARVLGTPPLAWFGEISYGAYLFHGRVPVAVADRTGLSGRRCSGACGDDDRPRLRLAPLLRAPIRVRAFPLVSHR